MHLRPGTCNLNTYKELSLLIHPANAMVWLLAALQYEYSCVLEQRKLDPAVRMGSCQPHISNALLAHWSSDSFQLQVYELCRYGEVLLALYFSTDGHYNRSVKTVGYDQVTESNQLHSTFNSYRRKTYADYLVVLEATPWCHGLFNLTVSTRTICMH